MQKKYVLAIFVIIAAFLAIGIFVLMPRQGGKNNLPPPCSLDDSGTCPADYAPSDWKTWQDGTYSKNNDTYHGYKLMYPRDFDVVQGEYAQGGFIGKSRVKIAFPQDAFLVPKTNFGGAYLTVSVGEDEQSVKGCYSNPSPGDAQKTLRETVSVNGAVFYKGKAVEAGAGNLYASEAYRVLNNNECYEVALTVHTGNIYNYPPGTVTEFDKEKAFSALRQVLHTFVFTDKNPFSP